MCCQLGTSLTAWAPSGLGAQAASANASATGRKMDIVPLMRAGATAIRKIPLDYQIAARLGLEIAPLPHGIGEIS